MRVRVLFIFLTSTRVAFEWRRELFTCAVIPTFHVAHIYIFSRYSLKLVEANPGIGECNGNGIFRLYRFSEILGQPLEVHPIKISNSDGNSRKCLFHSLPNPVIFGRMESPHESGLSAASRPLMFCCKKNVTD